MRCLYPRTVGFLADGKTISWSQKNYSKEYPTFQLPCTKCIECRLQYSLEWAIRSVKEAQMYENNSFITLTYSDENLGDNKLDYNDWQNFAKKLRTHIESDYLKSKNLFEHFKSLDKEQRKVFKNEHQEAFENIRISILCTGEYGSKTKRKHWHALIFNWRPNDGVYEFSNDRGDKNYSSATLTSLWGKGHAFYGDITLESAGYCARYGLKQLTHGQDDSHEFKPISKKSNKNAIGKKWLEKYWSDVFNYGYVEHQGTKYSIPRYFLKWFQKHKPDLFIKFLERVKLNQISLATERNDNYLSELKNINNKRIGLKGPVQTQLDHKRKIVEQKNKNVENFYKL